MSSNTQKDVKPQTGSKLVYKKNTFEMDSKQGGVTASTTAIVPDASEKKAKSSLVFKKQHDFNPEALGVTADTKPQIATMFTSSFMNPTSPIPQISQPTPTPTFGMPQQAPLMASYNPNMMYGMPMANPMWGFAPMPMAGFTSNPQQGQVPAMTLQQAPQVIPSQVQSAPVAASQLSSSTNEKWREKMRQQKLAASNITAASTAPVQKPEPPKEDPKKEDPPRKESAKKEEPPKKDDSPKKEPPKKEEPKPVEPPQKDSSSEDDSYNDEPAVDNQDGKEEEEEEEDYSAYPQERPRKIVYSRDMILEFIRKEADREDKDLDEQFEDLMRDIQIINKTPGFRPNKPPYSGGGGRGGDRDRGDPRSRPSRYGGGGGGGGGGGPKRDNPSSSYNEPKNSTPAVLNRAKMTSAEKKRYEQIKKETGDLISKRDQADDMTKKKKEINLYLFQLTPENYEEVSEKMKPFCTDIDSCETCIHMLIDKAWSQTKYTEIYARLCADLGTIKFDWFDIMSEDKKREVIERHKDADCHKIYRSFVVNKVRVEFMKGFEKFKNTMNEAESKQEYSDEDKTAVYNRSKGKVLANMSFIAELFKKKYIPPKVIKTITYIIINQFIDDFCKESTSKVLFSTSEVFLEAFFRLMEICGDMIEPKEAKDDSKKSPELQAQEKSKIKAFVDAMMVLVKNRKIDKEVPKVLSEDEKKSINICTLMFGFLRALKESNKISPRLTSLIENAEDNRRNTWRGHKEDVGPKRIAEVHKEVEYKASKGPRPDRNDRRGRDDDYKGGRYGKSSRYEDDNYYSRKDGKGGYNDEEYVKVEPTAASTKKSADPTHIDGLVRAIFESTQAADVEELTKQLSKDNKDFDGSPGDLILASFLKNFITTSAANADARSVIASSIVKSFGVAEDSFLSSLTFACNELKYEDLPFLKKVLAKALVITASDNSFNVEKMTVKWPTDEDDKDELKYFLKEVCEEVEKWVSSLGKDPKIAAGIKTFREKSL